MSAADAAVGSDTRSGPSVAVVFAGLMLVIVPLLLVYALLQRHIVKGIAAGALKG